MLVSLSPHVVQRSESTRRILCKRSFVGRMSCMTVYHTGFASSEDHVVCGVFHTLAQSVVGWIFVTRMSLGRFPTVDIVCKVT
jgi:hypothetical protein